MDNIYTLVIFFSDFKKIQLRLLQEQEVIEAVDFSFDSNLDTVLIENIDKVLKKNRITTSSLKEVKIEGTVDPNSSAYKVAQTWIEAVKTF